MPMGLGSYASRTVATNVVATDGTGDFTDIQTAINALPSTGGVVYIKEGTYTITSTISITKPNVVLDGAGKSTKIQTTADIPMISITTNNYNLIRDVYLYGAGNGKTNNQGINCASSNCTFQNCFVENCGNVGIYTNTGIDNIIMGNFLTGNYGIGIYALTRATTSNNIIGPHSAGGILGRGNHQIITGNYLNSVGGASINLDAGGYGIISNNIIIGPSSRGIQLSGVDNSIISSNLIKSLTGTGFSSGILLFSTATRNIITGNSIIDNSNFGVFVYAAAELNNAIVGNIIYNNAGGNIVDNGTGTINANNITT